MSKFDRTSSDDVAHKVCIAENRCFQNVYWALQHVPQDATLVIGFATLWGHCVRHAWIEVGDSIIDPSWVGFLDEGEIPHYRPVHRYTKSQVKKLSILKLGRVHREALFSEWCEFGRIAEQEDASHLGD